MSLVPLFPGHPSIGDNELLPDNQTVHLKFPRLLGGSLQQAIGGGDGEEDGDQAVFHGMLLTAD